MAYGSVIYDWVDSDLSCTHDLNPNCDICRLLALCLPVALGHHDVKALYGIMENRRALSPGAHLYLQGQAFTALGIVISGSVKTYRRQTDGWISVFGFSLPGEMVGFSGIANEYYRNSAQATENTVVCEIPFSGLADLVRVRPDLKYHLLQLMSRRLVRDSEAAALFLHQRRAKMRISVFLLRLSRRVQPRWACNTNILLPMSRIDIGNYLGITPETVSRELAQLKRHHIISIEGRKLIILDPEKLRAEADIADCISGHTGYLKGIQTTI